MIQYICKTWDVRPKFAAFVLAVIFGWSELAQASLSAGESKNHIGETASVCGNVESTHFSGTSKGKPTFLNLDKPYPNQIFTIVIWGSDRAKFGNPETVYRSKRICVSGTIESYRNVPQIVARDPSQIQLESK